MHKLAIIAIVVISLLMLAFLLCFIYLWKGYRNPFIMEGVEIPSYVKSDHQHFNLRTPEYKEYMENEFRTLGAFAKFAQDNDILYTLVAGSLIGLLSLGQNVPWDDDIDMIVRESDWPKIQSLWNNGTKIRCPDNRFFARNIAMNDEIFILLMHKEEHGWVKLLKSFREDLPDIGGIDLGYAWMKNGKVYESMNHQKEAPGTTSEYDIDEMALYKFGTVKIMSVNPELGDKYLSKIYNKGWKQTAKQHPDYFHKGFWGTVFGKRFIEIIFRKKFTS
jgi:hypothetical protein